MPTQEKKFVKDPSPNMTVEEQNMHLSAKLAVAPYSKRKIVCIERIETEMPGWLIHYQTG